jgi:hypothetical protein
MEAIPENGIPNASGNEKIGKTAVFVGQSMIG